jgi:hypothetical protein
MAEPATRTDAEQADWWAHSALTDVIHAAQIASTYVDAPSILTEIARARAHLDDAEGYLRHGYAGWQAKRGSSREATNG